MMPVANDRHEPRFSVSKRDEAPPCSHTRRRWVRAGLFSLFFAIHSAPGTGVWAAGTEDSTPISNSPAVGVLQEGLRALEAKQIPKARQHFERAYRMSAIPEALYQLGRVAQLEGNAVLAADLFRRYRDLVGSQLEPAVKAVIESHQAALKQPVCEVRLLGPEDSLVWVDGQLIGRSPLVGAALLSPGRHRFTIETTHGRYESDVLSIPEGRTAQVNLTPGTKGAAIAVVSLPPAVLLVLSGALKGRDSSTVESLRRTISSALAKEQTVVLSDERLRSLLQKEPADCIDQQDCQDRVAETAEARSVVQVNLVRSTQTPSAAVGLLGAEVIVRDVASRQIAARRTFACEGCSPSQLQERFGQMAGGMIAEANSRPRAMLTITTVPLGASVYVDGQLVGQTPLERMSFAGSHTVRGIKEGYEPNERTVDVQLGRSNAVDLKLTAQSTAARPQARSTWRLVLGGVLAGGGLLTAAMGVSALSVHGQCDETMPAVDGKPCPMIYSTKGIGGGLLGAGLAVTAAGVLLMAIPDRKIDPTEHAYDVPRAAPALAISF